VHVRFWGTRGSIPVPGPSTVRFGGNTACVEVRSAAGTLVVIDCGTGARQLGQQLVAEAASGGGSADGALLIGHTHWDHIHGLPFFAPLFEAGNEWQLYGPRGLGESLAHTLAGQMQYLYFPVDLEELAASVTYHDLVEGTFEVGDLFIRTQYLNHPVLTLGYRIEADGVTLVYASDHEPHDSALGAGGDLLASPDDARHVAFLEGADVLIHDTQYLAEEYGGKVGWGHSTLEYVLDAARLSDVGTLVLFHHDPQRSDADVDAMVARAQARASDTGWGGTVIAAAEGAVLDAGRRERAVKGSSLDRRSATSEPVLEDLSASVLLAVRDPELAAAVRAAAESERLPVVDVAGLGGVVEAAATAGRTVLVVDHDEDEAVLENLLRLRQEGTLPARAAVLALTRHRPPIGAGALVTDWLVWPSTLGHVRTKLRAVVLRRACRWQSAPLPPDEVQRLRALHGLAMLDTEPEERFDRYTQLACRALRAPVALVSLIDSGRQWFKSHLGTPVEETPRDQSLCAHAILGSDVFQVPDLLEDDRFADNPAVRQVPRARFYAGVPLQLPDGSRVGTLCVIDHRPRVLDDGQLEQLRTLAALVEVELTWATGASEGPDRT
jgi:phosphoribosyl 1,2-cyclic phosphodiesterase